MNLKPSLKLGGQAMVLVVSVEMYALLLCNVTVLNNCYFRH